VMVVVGSTVVVGAVTVGRVVVAPNVTGPVVVVRPTVAAAPVVTGRVVVVGPLAASGVVSALVVDGAREVLGWRGRVVVVDAAVGAGSAGTVDSAPGWPGAGGAGSWGPRAAEATKAPRTEAVSPKANSVSRQGCRGGSRCRGDRLGIGAVVPVRLVLPLLGCRPSAPYRPPRTWPRTIDRTARSCQSSGRGQCSRAAAEDGGTQASRGYALRSRGWLGRRGRPRRPGPMTWPIFWFAQADASLPGSVAELRYLTQPNADFPVPVVSYRMARALPPTVRPAWAAVSFPASFH
jgi:hypothetical protein